MTVTNCVSDDVAWSLSPTALEIAHYNRLLVLSRSAQARQEDERSQHARQLFGDCLMLLMQLGLKEKPARSLIGKWRGLAKDDPYLISVIRTAHRIGTPDPAAYVRGAIRKTNDAGNRTERVIKSEWRLLGWERPSDGEWKGEVRGKLWLDPFGNAAVLPADKGEVIPSLEEDPGVEISR